MHKGRYNMYRRICELTKETTHFNDVCCLQPGIFTADIGWTGKNNCNSLSLHVCLDHLICMEHDFVDDLFRHDDIPTFGWCFVPKDIPTLIKVVCNDMII